MDRPITASEANQRFSEMLRDVANGESFTVTSRGRPVARVVPVQRKGGREAVKRLIAYFEANPVGRTGPWTRDDLYD